MYRPKDIGDSNKTRCGFRDCFDCCIETEMIMTELEAETIERETGYMKTDFLVDVSKVDGFYQLKNVNSVIGKKCFFLSNKGKCTIYKVAPKGCKMYPLILNIETDEAMVDVDCREVDWFSKQTYLESQITSIKHLVSTLILEGARRFDELKLYSSVTEASAIYFDDSDASSELKELIEKRQEEQKQEEERRKRESL